MTRENNRESFAWWFGNQPGGLQSFGSGSYGYNWTGVLFDGSYQVQGLGGGDMAWVWCVTAEHEVVSPSDMIAMADAHYEPKGLSWAPFWESSAPQRGNLCLDDAFRGSIYNEVMRGLPADDPAQQALRRRHGGRWNVGFCDGHVENLRADGLFDLANPMVARRWNKDNQPHNQFWHPPPPP